MRELTKEQVRARLAAPNGSQTLFDEAEAAFDAAWALFTEEGNAAACAFLCRCAAFCAGQPLREWIFAPKAGKRCGCTVCIARQSTPHKGGAGNETEP